MKMILKYILMLFLTSLFFISCEKTLLGEPTENTPENNFEIFWQDLDDSYGLFYARGWNWDSIYQVYRPQVNAQTTDDELWGIFGEMIDYLDDRHTRIHNPVTDSTYRSNGERIDIAREEFDIELVKDKYVDPLKMADGNEYFLYGKVKDKEVGYIFIDRMGKFDPDKIDVVINELEDYEAIIFDIRGNRGGEDVIVERLAGAFADGEHFVYTSQTRNGKNHDDFDEKFDHYTLPIGDKQYSGYVIILTDRATISAGEEFLLHMRAFDKVTLLGDYTSGDFSDLSTPQFLPNGWLYVFSTQMYLLPDGTNLDGIGIKPDVTEKNYKSDIDAGNDIVFERALDFLLTEYGIE